MTRQTRIPILLGVFRTVVRTHPIKHFVIAVSEKQPYLCNKNKLIVVEFY